MALIPYHLHHSDREQLFKELYDDDSDYITDLMVLVYLGNNDLDGSFSVEANPTEAFEDLVKASIEEAELSKGNIPTVSVNIEVETETASANDVIERVLKGEGTRGDLLYLDAKGAMEPLMEKIAENETNVVVQGSSSEDPLEISTLDAQLYLTKNN
ncbi:hypothetical protein [Natrarchaeobaculum sulfurireducens]|uniref:hypothetical protein n=1 Tax=Natrarchaeobaculum sulfurireducens TaxID=2044521 RepID=UPI00105AB0EA|nr:hypothetical protein [Natrarchaeobaculum sulfurireducens]